MGDLPNASADLSPNMVVEPHNLSPQNRTAHFELGRNVVIYLDPLDAPRDRDSSNVHTKTIIDYKGEIGELQGKILTTHKELIAFRCFNKSTGETVRTIDLNTRNRYQFKNILHNPMDISYASNAPLIAIIDSESSLFVYKVHEGFNVKLYVGIMNWPSHSSRVSSEKVRIAWCPFVPESPVDGESSEDLNMLAVYSSRHVHIINLSLLKESNSGEDVIDFEDAKCIPDAIFSVTIDDEDDDVHIKTVCISPDSTAVAVSKSSGIVCFYVINDDGLSFAHYWEPNFGSPVVDLIFLDDLRSDRKDVPFWGTCLAIAQGGRQMALFECRKWRCLGRLRFETSVEVNDFIAFMDSSTKFIHLLDIDGSNIYSLEISMVNNLPRFAAVTQTSFCRPIMAFAPLTTSSFDNDADQSLDDMFGNESDTKEVHCTFAALTSRSLVELKVTLDLHEGLLHADDDGDDASDEAVPKPLAYSNRTTEILESTQSDIPKQTSEQNSFAFDEKYNSLLMRVEALEAEKTQSNDHLIGLINSLANESREREERMLDLVKRSMENCSDSALSVIVAHLAETRRTMEDSLVNVNHKSIELISQQTGHNMRQAFTEVVVPSLERTCAQLFERLNISFQMGIKEYMKNMRSALQANLLSAAHAPPTHGMSAERLKTFQLLQQNPAIAFEFALNQGDAMLLEEVCSKMNPDVLFSQPNSLSQPVLVSLLQQLTMSLDHERDLKYRYIEHILAQIKPNDVETAPVVPNVIGQLLTTLSDIMEHTDDPSVRRQTRVIFSLARSIGFQSPLPSSMSIGPMSAHSSDRLYD